MIERSSFVSPHRLYFFMNIQSTNKSNTPFILSGNQVCAKISHYLSDAMFIYPITPSTGASEHVESLLQSNTTNIFNCLPKLQQMQSEAGSISACHGASHTGASATTFTSSQGLLLMAPDIIKMVGERKPAVIQVAARSIARSTLNIFGDHSDVMQLRGTGAIMICSANQAECAFNSVMAYLLAFKLNVPVIHFYDGFQTSHEMQSVIMPSKQDLTDIWNNYEKIFAVQKARPQQSISESQKSLTEQAIQENTLLIGTSSGSIGLVSNDDTNFQLSIGLKHEIDQFPQTIENIYKFLSNEFKQRQLLGIDGPLTLCLSQNNQCTSTKLKTKNLQQLEKHSEDDKYQKIKHIIIGMGSGMDIIHDKIGETQAVLKISAYRPLPIKNIAKQLSKLPNLQNITILERNLEYNSQQVLYQEVLAGLLQEKFPLDKIHIASGVYGIGGKELSAKNADQLLTYFEKQGKATFFTLGLTDDVGLTDLGTMLSLMSEQEKPNKKTKKELAKQNKLQNQQCQDIAIKLYGIGSEGFVKAAETLAQLLQDKGYQVQKMSYFDAKKSGGLTESDVRAGEHSGVIKQHNRIQEADGIVVSQGKILAADPMILTRVKSGGVVLLLNQQTLQLDKHLIEAMKKHKIKIYNFDVEAFKKDNNLPYSFKVNFHALQLLQNILQMNIGEQIQNKYKEMFPKQQLALPLPQEMQKYINEVIVKPLDVMEQKSFLQQFENHQSDANVIGEAIANNAGDKLPVSAFMEFVKDPKMKNGTSSQHELTKHGISQHVAKFLPEECIECGRCTVVCPHGVIQAALLTSEEGSRIKKLFQKVTGKALQKLHKIRNHDYFLAVNEKGCTGCSICVHECPTNALKIDKVDPSNTLFEEVSQIVNQPDYQKRLPKPSTQPKAMQFSLPFNTCHSACQGCGETAYINLLGKVAETFKNTSGHLDIVQGTGCPLVYLGQIGCQSLAPETFWTNSLFENTAEVALGMNKVLDTPVWAIMGDGAAIDINFGGLSFVLSKHNNVKTLVLDTNGYSNTGGQYSSTSLPGTKTSLATKGVKETPKDLFKIGLMHGNCYVATVTMENPTRTAKIFQEAQKFDGPALIIAYSPCISSKPDSATLDSIDQMKKATKSGIFPLMVYDPRKEPGKRLTIESKKEEGVEILHEGRVIDVEQLQKFTDQRWEDLQRLATIL